MLAKIHEAVYFTVWKLYSNDKVKLHLCVHAFACVLSHGNLLSRDNVTMMWMATRTRKEGFKQEIFMHREFVLKPERIMVLLLVLRPEKEKLGGRWQEGGRL